ncbi:hypothetical protein B2A_09012 [mine drainage metagenome]|uniref:DUF892 family protein n=1 Tax=mine drainage metagenome TaxID=410659 RepID=T1AZJ6_9ZZZZ
MATRSEGSVSNHIRLDKDPIEVKNILLSKVESLLDGAISEYKALRGKATYNNVKEMLDGLIESAEKEKGIVKELRKSNQEYESSKNGEVAGAKRPENSIFEHLLDANEDKLRENDIGSIIMHAINVSAKLNTVYYILLNEYSHSAINGSFRILQEIENSKMRKLDKLYEALVVRGAY